MDSSIAAKYFFAFLAFLSRLFSVSALARLRSRSGNVRSYSVFGLDRHPGFCSTLGITL